MEQSDVQFKDGLRRDRIIYERWLKLLNNGNIEDLKEEIQIQIDRIKRSLQD